MRHVQLAVSALLLHGAALAAQEHPKGDWQALRDEVTFATSSGMSVSAVTSPLGGLEFGHADVPARLARHERPRAPIDGMKAAAPARAEELDVGRLNGARPVPEPPAFVMLLAGLAVLCVVVRRR